MQSKDLDIPGFRDDVAEKIKTQSYDTDKIEGIKIIDIPYFVGEQGDFSEIVRINDDGELTQIPGFKVAQVNRTRLIPGSIKAWHLHFRQTEVWHVLPSSELFVGLWDIRRDSPTSGTTMRIAMGGGKSQLLFIPKGVAHGSANFSNNPSELLYIVNHQFDIKNPDERRIPWDSLGSDFWTPLKD